MNNLRESFLGLFKKKIVMWSCVGGVIMCALLWNNFHSLFHNTMELRRLQKKSIALDKEYEELLKIKSKLINEDLSYIEEIARTQYNLAKPDEIEFRIKKN